jgi:hypothetical protein
MMQVEEYDEVNSIRKEGKGKWEEVRNVVCW